MIVCLFVSHVSLRASTDILFPKIKTCVYVRRLTNEFRKRAGEAGAQPVGVALDPMKAIYLSNFGGNDTLLEVQNWKSRKTTRYEVKRFRETSVGCLILQTL